jgi:tRNA threonylcarbamoyladenosine biosynthesis protein TsaB
MLILGIETSHAAGSVALVRDGAVIGEAALETAGRRHARSLIAEIGRLLQSAGLRARDLEAVAVSLGPGSFTGLRVGVVAAKTLAYATGCRVAGVETFLAIAENSPPGVSDLWVIGNAQRGELYAGRHIRGENGRFTRDGELSIVGIDEFCARRAAGDAVSGPGVDLLPEACRGALNLLPPEERDPRATVVARLGERAISDGQAADPWTLAPLYLRKSAAEEKWDLRHG